MNDNRVFSNARVVTRAASGIRLYSSTGNTVISNVSYDNEDSGIESYTGSNNNADRRTTSCYGNGDHGIDNYSSTGQRIISNSVYDNVTAGINLEGGSTGGTLANNIASTTASTAPGPRATSASTPRRPAARRWTTTSSTCEPLATMMIWGNTSYATLSAFVVRRPGRRRTAFRQIRCGSTRPATISTCGRDRRPSTRPTPAPAASRLLTSTDNPRVDDPATAEHRRGAAAVRRPRCIRVQPSEDPPTRPPSASLVVTPSSGAAPLQVTADAIRVDRHRRHADRDLQVRLRRRHRRGAAGRRRPLPTPTRQPARTPSRVTVTDTAGLASSTTAQVTVASGDAPPAAALTVVARLGRGAAAGDGRRLRVDGHGRHADRHLQVRLRRRHRSWDRRPARPPTHTYTTAGTYTVHGDRHGHGWPVVDGHRPRSPCNPRRRAAGCSADGLPQLGRGAAAGDGGRLRRRPTPTPRRSRPTGSTSATAPVVGTAGGSDRHPHLHGHGHLHGDRHRHGHGGLSSTATAQVTVDGRRQPAGRGYHRVAHVRERRRCR